MTVRFRALVMDLAVKMAKVSIDACRKQGFNVAVTVTHRGGHPQVVLRDTQHGPHADHQQTEGLHGDVLQLANLAA